MIAWFASNRVAANMLMLSILVLGLLLLPATQKEILPDFTHNEILISSSLPGATPEQVEQLLCPPLEQAVLGQEDVAHVYSTAAYHACQVTVELHYGAQQQQALEAIQKQLQTITLPQNASPAQARQFEQNVMIARLMISGNNDYRQLRQHAEYIQQGLLNTGLHHVVLRDAKPYQIQVRISQAQLQRYQVSFAELANVIRQYGQNITTGQIDTQTGYSAIVIDNAFHNTDELGNLLIRAYPDGGHLYLKDIADITDGFANSALSSRLNGQPAVSISVYQQSNLSILDISQRIQGFMDSVTLPAGLQLVWVQDNANVFNNRMALLRDNAIAGLLLVFVCLWAFLRLRLAFWVSMGIPVAFMGAFICLFLTGTSINVISTFALLLVLGLVVDDAIIVAENIYQHQQSQPGLGGAIQGTREFARPVVFAVLTTMICFAPLLFLPGAEGQLLAQIPIVIIATLAFSLIECLWILPAHLSGTSHSQKSTMTQQLDTLVQRFYRPLLVHVLQWRYTAVTGFIACLCICIALLLSGWIKVDFLSRIEAEVATGHVAFPQGMSLEKTQAAVQRMEQAALQLRKTLKEETGTDQILHIRTLISDEHFGDVFLSLASGDQRRISGDEMMRRWKTLIGPIKDASELRLSSSFEHFQGNGFSIKLQSQQRQSLEQASLALREHLKQYPGVSQVHTTFTQDLRETRLQLKDNAHYLQLNTASLSQQLQQAFSGIEIKQQRDNGQQQTIYLSLPDNEKNSLWHLENLPIRLPDNSLLPLSAVADLQLASSPAYIHREGGKRIALVSAELDSGLLHADDLYQQVNSRFIQSYQQQHPEVFWGHSQQQRYQDKLKQRLGSGFLIALIVMLVLMAMLLASYTQPLMILSAVPFGLIGALLGHAIFQQPLTIWSMAGMVAVSGIVVNDNMVLVFYINEKLKQGQSLDNAIVDAGSKRFRPILLTTITTSFGLLPMLMDNSWEAQFMIPMALSISFGVLFATAISLFLVPALYRIGGDVKARIQPVNNH